jgi:hypothetical protein
VFCLRERELDAAEALEEVERVPVAESRALELPLTVAMRYDAMPRGPGLDVLVRETILQEIPSPFRFAQLTEGFPGVPAARLRRIVAQLKREGRVERTGAGPRASWSRS